MTLKEDGTGIEELREPLGKSYGKICISFPSFNTGGYIETEAAAQESLGLGKLGTQAEKDRRLKKK